MSEELQYRVSKVFSEFRTLVEAIPLDGKILSDDAKNGTKGQGKGSLAKTGTVWEACDATIGLKKLGIAGLVIKKAEELQALLKDALEELQEWGEEESDEEDGARSEEDEAQAAVDNIFGSQRHISTNDPEKIRPRLESATRRLRLLGIMYKAAVKRRFKTLPLLPKQEPVTTKEDERNIATCVDEVMGLLKKIPDIADELASSFYELDAGGIDKRMDECFFTAYAATELLLKDWEGKEDEFSTWVRLIQ